MSQEQTPKQAEMDPEQLRKMTEVMSADIRELTNRLNSQRQENERLMKEQAERDAKYEELNKNWTAIKEEKKRNLADIVSTQVKPFLEELKKDQSETLVENVNTFEGTLNQGLENAFMDKSEMAMLQTVQAAASAMKATSSELERMFQSDKAWTEKFGALKKEHEEYTSKTAEELKKAKEEAELKDKLLTDLKSELEGLKSIHAKNVMAVDNHFEESKQESQPTETSAEAGTTGTTDAAPAVVDATASNQKSTGFNTLFDFDGYKPNMNWKNNRRHGW